MGLRKQFNKLTTSLRDGLNVSTATNQTKLLEFIGRLRPSQITKRLVRVGPKGDGGYLVPDDLVGIAGCISPGVSLESGFDFDVAERGIDVFMADASVDGPILNHPKFHFEKLFLGTATAGNTITIDEFCRQSRVPPSGDLILQMDIEGAEYGVIQNMSRELLKRFRIMVIEFHGLDNLFHRFSFELLSEVFNKVLLDHRVVHIHPNNCCGSKTIRGIEVPKVIEMTFYRADRSSFSRSAPMSYPHELDSSNIPRRKPLTLPMAWR